MLVGSLMKMKGIEEYMPLDAPSNMINMEQGTSENKD
jgi:hypothetical protein